MQIDGKKFLITWPKSDQLTPEIIKNYMEDIGEIEYACICQEKHQDGIDHHHALLMFKNRIRKKGNPFNCHECKSNVKKLRTFKDCKKALKYVKKDGVYIEIGKAPYQIVQMDKREKLFFALRNDDRACIDSGQYSFSELTKLQTIRNMWYNEWPQFKKREVLWFHGGTGTGKTRTAWQYLMEEYEINNIWCSSGRLDPFFIGYTGQEAVILDDLRPGSIKFELLLRILDGYPVHVNVKGSQCLWRAEKIIITAPVEPGLMFINRETGEEWDHLDQLRRRIDEIKGFGELTSPSQFVSD